MFGNKESLACSSDFEGVSESPLFSLSLSCPISLFLVQTHPSFPTSPFLSNLTLLVQSHPPCPTSPILSNLTLHIQSLPFLSLFSDFLRSLYFVANQSSCSHPILGLHQCLTNIFLVLPHFSWYFELAPPVCQLEWEQNAMIFFHHCFHISHVSQEGGGGMQPTIIVIFSTIFLGGVKQFSNLILYSSKNK